MAVLCNNVIAGASIADDAAGGDAYQIEKSLRFNDDDSAHLLRTVAGGNVRTFTLSFWIKNCKDGTRFFSTGYNTSVDAQREGYIGFNSAKLTFNQVGGASGTGGTANCNIWTEQVFRDPSAWYNVVIAVDTTQATSSERVKIYVNGKQAGIDSSYNTYPGQNETFSFAKSGKELTLGCWRLNGSLAGYHDGYFADWYYIDGLALSPAAFGSFDSTGVWNPKAFAFPAPNTGTTWSSSLTNDQNNGFNNSTSAANLFDGDLTTYISGNGNFTFTPPGTGIEYTTSVEVYFDYGSDSSHYEQAQVNSLGWVDLEHQKWKTIHLGSGTLTTLKFRDSRGTGLDTSWMRAIRIDGVILVDGVTDPDTYQQLNDGGKHSDNVSGTIYTGYPLANAFNGNVVHTSPTGRSVPNSDSWLTWTPPTAISMKRLRVWFGYKTTNGNFKINGTQNNTNLASGTNGWIEYTGYTSISSIAWYCGPSGAEQSSVGAIEIDGVILLDDIADNSFHLKFNDTSLNRYLGKDTLNGKIEDATGGLPIYNTKAGSTDAADYGDVKDGTAIRTDSNKANLVFAVSGDSIADISNHADLRNSGSAKTITTSGSPAVTTDQSRFYGSSISIGNYNEGNFFYVTPANGGTDFDFGTDSFCFETWSRSNSTSHNSDSLSIIFDTDYDSTGLTGWIMLGYSGNDLKFWYVNAAGNAVVDVAVATNANIDDVGKWVHHAITHDSSTNKLRVFRNGVNILEKSSGDFKADWTSASGLYIGKQGYSGSGGVRYGKGEISDFRVYKGAPVYTANFKPPTRNDFTVNNINATDNSRSIADATKALPIYNTTGTHGGTKGSGYRNDPHKANLVLAIPGDVLTDVSNHADLRNSGSAKSTDANGNTAVSTAKSRFYGSSISFDGTSDYLEVGNSSDYDFDGDFTVEAWIYVNAYTNDYAGIFGFSHDSDQHGWNILMRQDGTPHINVDMNYTDVANAAVPLKKWTHIALVRSGTSSANVKFYTNGAQGSTTLSENDSTGTPSSTECMIGSYPGYETTREFNGFIQDIRIYKGVAKYTTAFDPEIPDLGVPEGIDSLTDTPTNYGDEDTGIGGEVRGSYATFNPLKLSDGTITYSQGNLSASGSAVWWGAGGTIAVNKGKWYWEVDPEGENKYIGIQEAGAATGAANPQSRTGTIVYYHAGHKKVDGASEASYGDAYTAENKIGVALDLDSSTQTVTFYKDNSSQGTLNLSESTNLVGKTIIPLFCSYGGTMSVNFGQRAFKYTAPEGYKALCTQNLDDTFDGDEVNNPSKYFDVLTYTGTGTNDSTVDTQTVSGLGFQPDLIVIKNRQDEGWWQWSDAVRGPSKNISTNSSNAESTNTDKEVTPTSNGFTLEDGEASLDHMWGGHKYLAHCWDAGTAAATASTDGSITPSAQWVNATSGFSISQFENVANSQTIGHGLSAEPEFIITKNIDNTVNWQVYHKSAGSSVKLYLDTTSASVSSSMWGSGHTNTVFTYDDNTTNTVIAYCWTAIPGYSAFGKYSANASADGPFVSCGFKPRWIMIKAASSAGDMSYASWLIVDSERDTYNVADAGIFANKASAEGTRGTGSDSAGTWLDILSNGFKIRYAGTEVNGSSGQSYIYAAFAEHPFKTARAA